MTFGLLQKCCIHASQLSHSILKINVFRSQNLIEFLVFTDLIKILIKTGIDYYDYFSFRFFFNFIVFMGLCEDQWSMRGLRAQIGGDSGYGVSHKCQHNEKGKCSSIIFLFHRYGC